MNLKQFRYVLTLANEGTFSKAAEKLNISQPSLSQYIKNIEMEVGTLLFQRTGASVRLTDAGKVYIEAGRKILDIEHQMNVKISDISSDKNGTISIGLSAHRSIVLMPSIVKEFKENYPRFNLILDERARIPLMDAAEHGEFDFCLTTLPVNERIFDVTTVMFEENIIAVPVGKISDKLESNASVMENRIFPAISVAEFDGFEFAMLNEDHLMQKELMMLCDAFNLNFVKTVECTSLEALIGMVAVNMGLAFIPQCLALENSKIRYFSIKEETNRREIVLINRKNQILTQPMLDLKEIIKRQLENQ